MRNGSVAILVGLSLLATAAPLVGSGTAGAQAPNKSEKTSVGVLPTETMLVGKASKVIITYASTSGGTVHVSVTQGVELGPRANCQPVKDGLVCKLPNKQHGRFAVRTTIRERIGQPSMVAILSPNKGKIVWSNRVVLLVVKLG